MSEQNNAPVDAGQEALADSGEGLDATQQTPPALDASAPKTDAQTIARLKKLKLKVDGQEIEEDLPFEIEDRPEIVDWMKRNLQLSKVSQKRMNEYSTLEKEVSQFINELRDNPRGALSSLNNLGIDAKQLAARIIEEEIAEAKKSPEQIEKEKLEARLRELEGERESEKKKAKEVELSRLEKQAFDEYNRSIDSALEKSTLPKSNYVKSRVADYLILALQNDIKISPDQVLPMVEADIRGELKEMFSAAPEDVIEALVGHDNIKRVRRRYVKKAQQTPTPSSKIAADTGVKDTTPSTPAAKKTIKELFGV